MKSLRLILVLACVALSFGVAQGQIASALVAEGEPFANAPDFVVNTISGPAATGLIMPTSSTLAARATRFLPLSLLR